MYKLVRFLLVRDDDDDLVPVLLLDDGVVFGAKPLFQGSNRPSDLVGAGAGFDEEELPGLDDELAVEPSEPSDVRVHVVNQAHLENGI